MARSLVIGCGNLDRADDGVAFAVINAVRNRQGREPLGEEETGLEGLGDEVDTVFIAQLVPELMETLCDYEQVVFVDAHVYPDNDGLHCRDVRPEFTPASLTHHLTPGMLLSLVKAVYRREPLGHLVCIRGYNFDLRRELSDGTRARIEEAADYLLQWVNRRDRR